MQGYIRIEIASLLENISKFSSNVIRYRKGIWMTTAVPLNPLDCIFFLLQNDRIKSVWTPRSLPIQCAPYLLLILNNVVQYKKLKRILYCEVINEHLVVVFIIKYIFTVDIRAFVQLLRILFELSNYLQCILVFKKVIPQSKMRNWIHLKFRKLIVLFQNLNIWDVVRVQKLPDTLKIDYISYIIIGSHS